MSVFPDEKGTAMDLSGNPFVDTGLMVLSVLAGKDTVDELTFSDIQQVFGDGEQLARYNLGLKCFTMVFGTNGPLTQPAYKKSGKNKEIYLSIVQQLLRSAKTDGSSGQRCDLTGIRSDLNFHAVCARALGEAGLPVPERKWLGRDWVPLGGSLGNDAQALPVASRPLHVSAIALFALQYLPLGVFLFKGKLACPQSTESKLSRAWVANVVKQNEDRLSLGQTEILGKGAGTGGALDLLMRCFEDLSYTPGTEALLWLFSNSGTGADCQIEEIPDATLAFISKALPAFGSEIRRFIAADPKDSRQQLFECIRGMRDYPGLYAYKKQTGASSDFYELYQQDIMGATRPGLNIARKLASFIVAGEPKRLKEIRKPEFLKSSSGRSLVRSYIINYLTPEEYDAIFPSLHHPVRVSSAGRSWLRYYLTSPLEDKRPISITKPSMTTTHPKIIQIAETYRDVEPRKIKNLLDRMTQRKIGIRWLQDKFCLLAEEHKDWDLGTWDEFVQDEDGRIVAFELLFQLRLHLSNIYREVKAKGEAA
jgi:hypothetical protein